MNTIQDIYELSPMQQGMLFHTLYAPETGIYFEQRHCLLEGRLNPQAFRAAWQQVCDRYTVLRSDFHWQETDKPLQVIYDSVELPWHEENWQAFNADEQSHKLDAFLLADRIQGFEIEQAPLMRCALFQLSETQYRFVWSHHHLLMDGWCNGVLIRDVLAIYAGNQGGQQTVLPPVKPYRDYIVWLQQQDHLAAKAYWQEVLRGFEAPVSLSMALGTALGMASDIALEPERLDHSSVSRADVSNANAVDHQQADRALSEDFSADLQTFAQRSRLTLNTVLQGAWAILLSRYSGLEDVLYGITVSGRPPSLAGVESMVGLFINTVPLRVEVTETADLLSWLQDLQQTQRDRETYSYSTLPTLQALTQVPSDRPLFESLLIFENYPISIEAATQSLATDSAIDFSIKDAQGYEQTNYPITLVVIPGKSIQLSLRYNTQHISNDAASRLLGHLETILSSFIHQPSQQLNQVNLLTPTEKKQIESFSAGVSDEISSDSVCQRFAARVNNQPLAEAVVFSANTVSGDSKQSQNKGLSYQQLNQRANQLAHALQQSGVQKGTRVGICLERSLEMVSSLLAILKLGGIYIPLDPHHPSERLSYILADVQAEILISTTEIVDTLFAELVVSKLSIKEQFSTFCLDKQTAFIHSQSTEAIQQTSPSPDDIAYILYTSGSTGKPKGVPICHYSLTNFLSSMEQISRISASETLLAVTTLAFDIAALEIFLPLVSGARLVIIPQAMVSDGERLAQQIESQGVTIMQATPATWRVLLNAGWQGNADLKIFCGGEALDFELARQLLTCGRELWNLYGPTETTIWSGALQVTQRLLTRGNVPIGSPIANTQFYVLDQRQRAVPIGVAGELYIGGAGLSLGYWQRDDLTAKQFVEVPLARLEQDKVVHHKSGHENSESLRLYRTGDRVRYRTDGQLDYLGRLDNQVKLRGFRIELGEIEACLARHPKVSQAVAIVTGEENPQLVAYLTLVDINNTFANDANLAEKSVITSLSQATSILTDELRELLSQQLPSYMVPTRYQIIDALPLTPNGKVDRRSLLAIQAVQATTQQRPKTPAEKLMAGIWSEVLQVENINLDNNFFELGGHSLLATRVISQVRQVFEVDVALRSLFEHPTLSAFVSLIQSNPKNQTQAFSPILKTTRAPVLSSAQQRQWLIAQLEPDSSAYNIPLGIRIKGAFAVKSLRESLLQVVLRHEPLRTVYPAVDGTAAPELLSVDSVELTLTDISGFDNRKQQTLITQTIQQQAQTPFDLAQDLPWRSHLLKLSDREHILLFTFHHIVTDGWSMTVLFKELAAFYQASQANENLAQRLPALPIRYADYAAWQKSLDLTPQLSYWKQQLKSLPPLLKLPTDYPRAADASGTGTTYEFRLSKTETEALQQFGRRHKATLFMTLLTAFKVLLYRYSGLTDLAIGTPIANRQQHELEGLIGLFVNTLVIRTQLGNNPRFGDLLAQVRRVTLDAYAHQDLPFEQLIEALDIPRSGSHPPLVQVMFALQNTVSIQDDLANDILQTSGLDWSSLTIETTKAKFDLTLDIRETERGLIGRWEYRSDLFSADRIHRLAGHFRNLLRALPESSDLRISELPMLSRHELKQLKRWSMPTSTQPQPKETVHQLFETQAQLNPTATAITYHQTQLSYQDLNEKANQLAYVLQRQEIAAETPVGIWAVRSPATIIAILATLKAGGTYVPLDPQYPVERLKWMISDTRMALLVGEFSENPVPQEIESVIPSIDLMATAEDIAAQPTVNPNSLSTTAESLAYVLYTSGSTGQPKGVCVTHQGITRLVKDPNYVTLTSDDILLQAAPLTFDASTFEVWGALLNGGKLVLLPEQMPSLTTLGQAIATHQVTTLWLTSGLFNLMVDEQLESLSSVRQLLAGGDVLSATHLRKALSVLKHTQIINGYGPTEGTTFTCCHSVTAQDLTSAIPIGYPISQTQVYVLDADLQQVPIGIPGELYIGGAGVARGYLQRPALTAEKFVPNPYFEVRGANAVHSLCLYKSGDRVRYRADGALEYLGRIDHQVKVRGFRLELGEIESAIEAYPAVQQSIVVVFGESAEEKRLVAYIEAATEKTTTEQTTTEQTEISRTETNTIKTHELRAFLLEKLPDYMIPVKFVWVETLPLTANGKVDKQSLPEPQWNIVNQSSGKLLQKYELPTTEIETTLIKIFSSLLPAESIGIHDNFFELGGDSILAMQIVSRAAQLGLSLSPKQLFQYQTVSELAKIVKRDVQRDNQIAAQPPISPAPATGEVPLTPIQRWFFEQDLANPHHFNQSVCLELPNDLNRKALAQAIAQLYTHHDALRLRFKQVDTQWRQAFSADITPPSIQWFDYSQLTLEDQNNAIAQQIPILQSSLNLEKGPLLSIGGFELGSARASQLFIAIHHLVVDGVSWRILLADLQQAYQQAYQQAINQESIRLFPKTHSYQQWANELSRRSRSSDIKADADYWSAIAQAQPFIIPQQDANQSFRNNSIDSSQTIFTTLPEQSTQALLQEVPAIYNTQILDVLLTAFTQSLTMWASCESVTIDLESYGRFSPELNLSRTVGWFTALYPVALSFRSENTLSDNLKSIQSQIKAVPHEGISYGLLCYMNNCDAVDNNLEVSEKLLQVAPPISFNYLGQLTTTSAAGFKRIELPESCRNTHQSLNNHRAHLIDVNSWIEAGELKVVWTFSHRLHTEAVIEKLATQFIQNLSALIDYCCTQENVEYAPEDFGLAQLDSSALASVLSQVSFATADSAAESAADLSPSVDSQKQDAQEQDAQEQEVSR